MSEHECVTYFMAAMDSLQSFAFGCLFGGAVVSAFILKEQQ